MYDQNFKNQAVKECVNGQSINATAKKYGVALTTLREWLRLYKEKMSRMQTGTSALVMPDEADITEEPKRGSIVKLNSVNISIDGYNVTMSKKDVVKLMEVFYQFDKQEV